MGLRGLVLVGLMAAILAGPARAGDVRAGDLAIGHPHVLATPPTARAAAGYLSVENHGTSADRLIGVTVAAPLKAQIHTTVEQDGVSRMRPVDSVEIPAGGSVTLAPKGTHVMFMGLTAPMAAGDRLEATLNFEQAGAVPVVFDVEDRAGGGEHSH